MQGNSMTSEDIKKLYKLYKTGMTATDVAKIMNISGSCVSRYYAAFYRAENNEIVHTERICKREFEKFCKDNGLNCKFGEGSNNNTIQNESANGNDSISLVDINNTLISMRNIFNYMLKYMKTMSEAWANKEPSEDEKYEKRLREVFTKNEESTGSW